MNERFVIDACALIAFLEDEPGSDVTLNAFTQNKRKK